MEDSHTSDAKAIFRGALNRNTLQNLLRDTKIEDAVKQLNAGVAFETARNLHACLIDEKAVETDLDIPELGKVRMRVLMREGLNYKIGIIRNGMYITDNLAHFDEPFKKFPLYRDFAAVIEPVGPSEGEWFKRLEGPKHEDLSAERISDPALRDQGQRAFERLAKKIRNRLKELAKAEPTSKIELDELNDFFASDQTRQEDDSATETDPKALKPTPVTKSPPKKKTVAVAKSEDEDQPPIAGPGDLPPGPEPGPVDGPGTGHGEGDGEGNDNPKPRGQPRARSIELQGERNLIPDPTAPQKRRLFFTAPATGNISLQVEATGLSSPDRLSIASASIGTVGGGEVVIVCKQGERISVDIVFDTPYSGPVETSAFVTAIEEAA